MLARSQALPRQRCAAAAGAPRAPLHVARVHRGGDRGLAQPVDISVHGRHVDVTPEVETHVRQRLSTVLDKFKGAQFLESDGGIELVDVRLMNSQAEVKVLPRIKNKAVNETFVRQGELKVCEAGNGWEDSLDRALDALDRKLHRWTKPAPRKVDYRRL